MLKSLLTAMAVCAALAVFAGNADVYAKKPHIHTATTAPAQSSSMAKGGPLHDCVHVTFRQCNSHDGNGPND